MSKPFRLTAFLAGVASLALAATANADPGAEHDHPRPPPPGVVSLQAQASVEVDNDTMRATLFAEAEDASPARLSDVVNRTVNEALRIAQADTRVKVKTGGYQTYPVYDKTRIVRWRARSELHFESADFKALSDLIGRLQGSMKLAGVDFSVSPAAHKRIEDELTAAAIADFQRRAQLIAQGFGASGYRVKEASVSGEGAMPPMPRPMMMRAAPMADAVQAPNVEAGTSRLAVSVNGAIVLEGK